MKRTRAGLPAVTRGSTESPAKIQRRHKELTPPKTPARARRQPEKQQKRSGEEEKLAGVGVESASTFHPLQASLALAEEGAVAWDVGSAELGGGWWWGVEEEKLCGWYPFADEDFLCSESRGGGGEFEVVCWEEQDHDIWQLQHIHEIPNKAK